MEKSDAYEVAPLSTKNIKDFADKIRNITSVFGYVNQNGKFDIVRLLEHGNLSVPGSNNQSSPLSLEVVEDNTLPNAEAMTFPDGTIKVRESVYESALKNDGRSRFTLAHELFHALVHCKQFAFCRQINNETKIYQNSEWQADMFAGHLLFPDELVKEYENLPEEEVTVKLGISKTVTRIRRTNYAKN